MDFWYGVDFQASVWQLGVIAAIIVALTLRPRPNDGKNRRKR